MARGMGAHVMSKVVCGLLMMTGITWMASSAVGERRGGADARLQRLLADAWEFDLNESPTFATSVGDLRSNDKLASATVEDYQRRLQARQLLLVDGGLARRLQVATERAEDP